VKLENNGQLYLVFLKHQQPIFFFNRGVNYVYEVLAK